MEIEATNNVVVYHKRGRVIFASKILLYTDAYTNMLLLGKELTLQTYFVYVVLA